MPNHHDLKRDAELRYIVLHHTGIAEPHYDLLIDTTGDGPLATWRVPQWPPRMDAVFTAIADHRREYLEYEGAISGDRGRVMRVAAGTCRVVENSSASLGIRLEDGNTLVLPRLERK